jgi:hypothetical protein
MVVALAVVVATVVAAAAVVVVAAVVAATVTKCLNFILISSIRFVPIGSYLNKFYLAIIMKL